MISIQPAMPPKKVLTIAEHAQKFHVQCCHFLTLLQQEGLQQVGSFEKVQGLLETLAVDFDLQRKGKQTKKVLSVLQHTKQKWHLKKKISNLEEKVREATQGKVSGYIQHLWFIRVAFSDEQLSARSLASWCGDFGVEPSNVISHTYVGHVKDCFCELVKQLSREELSLAASAHPASTEQPATSKPFFLVHAHDEASMRVRSWDHTVSGRIVRGRSSKIQNQSVIVSFGDVWQEWFVELVALMRKDGASIAETLINTTKDVVQTLTSFSSGSWTELRLIHLLVADSINTNANAAKRVWNFFNAQEGMGRTRIKYGLLYFHCASHIVNLVVMVAIVGEILAEPTENDDVCAAASRFYKYLVHDYLEEYNRSLRIFLEANVRVTMAQNAGALQSDLQLQHLYGQAVLPDALLNLLNEGLGTWSHTGSDKLRSEVVDELFRLLSRLLFFIEERPVPTRFWLFGGCVRGMLTMILIGLPAEVVKLSGANPHAENQKRLGRFLSFYTSAAAGQRLRQAALCLQLTDFALNITGQKLKTTQHVEREPLMIRLSRGDIEEAAGSTLMRILGVLEADPSLDLFQTIGSLLVTMGHLAMRLAQYKRYPCCLWKLTQKFNSEACVLEIERFLEAQLGDLDLGYSAQLQRDALAKGSLAASIRYLLSADIQEELVGIFEKASFTTLDVERKHYSSRRSEGRKYLSVSRASRNSILSRYKVLRAKNLSKRIALSKAAKSARFMSASALAVKANPAWLARPAGFHTSAHEGNPEALKKYREEHGEELRARAKEVRQTAQKMLVASKDSGLGLPLSNASWLRWLEEHESDFRQCMRTATQTRRCLSHRLHPQAEAFPAACRVGPAVAPQQTPLWVKKLVQCKSGWFCLEGTGLKVVFFACALRGEAWALLLQRLQGQRFQLDISQNLGSAYAPVQVCVGKLCGPVANEAPVYQLDLKVERIIPAKCIELEVVGAEPVIFLPKSRAAKKNTSEDEASIAEDDYDFHQDEDSDDAESLQSQVEEAAEIEQEEADTGKSDEEAPFGTLERHAPGTHLVFNSGYFSLMNYALRGGKSDCKILIAPRFCCDPPEGLGSENKSKTCQIAQFDQDHRPVRTYIVLRCWSLWRAQQGGGAWLQHSPARLRWYQKEESDIRTAIADLNEPAGTTGCPAADVKIRQWAPQVLV